MNTKPNPSLSSDPSPEVVDHRAAFLAWLGRFRGCECGSESPELHELAVLVLECVEVVGAQIFWEMSQIPLDRVRRDTGLTPPPAVEAMLAALERIHELMPGALEIFHRFQADEELFAPFRRNRCRDLARWILSRPAPEDIVGDGPRGGSVDKLAKHLRALDHDGFAQVLHQAGLIAPNLSH